MHIPIGASIVELPTKKRIGAKRKRVDRGNPSDVDGYLGPWAGYVDEKKVAKPTEVCKYMLTYRNALLLCGQFYMLMCMDGNFRMWEILENELHVA